MKSPIYWSPRLYTLAMKQLYGKQYEERFSVIAELIPDHSSVTEVCMGASELFLNHLSEKDISYTGLDLNSAFVKHAVKKGINARRHDLRMDPVPPADFVIIQDSLYQFIPHEKNILRKLLEASGKMLIVCEPVVNRAQSANPLISFIAKRAADPGTGRMSKRFNEGSLMNCFKSFPEFKEAKKIAGGSEMLGIFLK